MLFACIATQMRAIHSKQKIRESINIIVNHDGGYPMACIV